MSEQTESGKVTTLREAAPEPEPSVDDMPGMWERSDTFGGEADNAAPPAAPAPDGWVMVQIALVDAAKRLVEHADFQLGGSLSADSKASEIPSGAVSKVKARHLASLRDRITELSTAPAQPADQWKQAIDDELVCCHIGTVDTFPDAKTALKNLIDWHVQIALDPAISSDARALVERGAAQPAVPQPAPRTADCLMCGHCAATGERVAKPAAREPVIDEMDAVASKYAHKMALDLECVLSDYSGKWWDTAMQTLGAYREAMNAIHERESPTHLGEPVLPKHGIAGGSHE